MSWQDTVIMCHDFVRIRTYDELLQLRHTRSFYWHKPFFDKYANSIVKVTHFVRSRRRGKYMRIKFILSKSADFSAGDTLPVYVQEKILEKAENRIKLPNECFEL